MRIGFGHRGHRTVTVAPPPSRLAIVEAAAEELRLLADAREAEMALGADARRIEARVRRRDGQSDLIAVALERDGNVLALAVARRVREQLLRGAEERDLGRQRRFLCEQLADSSVIGTLVRRW